MKPVIYDVCAPQNVTVLGLVVVSKDILQMQQRQPQPKPSLVHFFQQIIN